MNINQDIIEAVKQANAPKVVAVKQPRWLKATSKRILNAVNNGLRTSTSIAHALGMKQPLVATNLWNLKNKGLVHSVKKDGSLEHKYYLTTDKNLSLAKIPKVKRTYTKRKAKAEVVVKKVDNSVEQGKAIVQMQLDINRYIQRISQLELALVEKDKEVWTLECEVFDKKAVIAYLESKLLAKGIV